jgi:hypothetical protein
LDTATGSARGRIGRTAEVVNQGVGPIAIELAGDAKPSAPRIDAAVEVLDRSELGLRMIIKIIADIKM